MKKRTIALLLALMLCFGCAIGGTVAWLTANSNSVTNTFVVGDIGELTLKENGEEAANNTEKFKIVPGVNITKDVEVFYSYGGSSADYEAVPVYVFVKIDTNTTNCWTVSDYKNYAVVNNGDTLLSWSVADDWTYLEPGVYYYKTVDAAASLSNVDVIANGTITVSDEITKDTIEEVSAAAADITFTAYAIQQEGFNDASKTEAENAAAAWAEVSK